MNASLQYPTSTRLSDITIATTVFVPPLYSLLKGSPYVFYSRGKINVKGLGEKQTYFVEPPSSGGIEDLVMIQPDSEEEKLIPIVSIGEEGSDDVSKGRSQEVIRSPSFVTYKTCTMVSTPSVQFLHPSPSSPKFETDSETRHLRPSRSSGLEMLRPPPPSEGVSPEGSPLPSPRTSNADSPSVFEPQIRRNKIAPHKVNELKQQPPPTLTEIPESGRTSRASNHSVSVIDAFISKNEKTGDSVDLSTSVASKDENEEENSSSEGSESENSSGSGKSNGKSNKRGKCVIS